MPVWLLLVGLATGASGQIYRCTGADGKTLWQDLPCDDARSEQRMPTAPGEGAASTASLEDWLRELRQRPERRPEGTRAPIGALVVHSSTCSALSPLSACSMAARVSVGAKVWMKS